ncbi:YwmB family TATA-box binding protein [Paenibacillus lactis]|uniref:YwmB family TATA-box binding protein n=1 Tax=Paenibacillus lactis TaxID=228574 RepID=UPI00367CD2C8
MGRISFQILGMVMVLCSLVGILVGFSDVKSSPLSGSAHEAPAAAAQAERDLRLLLQLGREHVDSGVRFTVKLQGESQAVSRDQAMASAEQVAQALGLPAVTAGKVHGNEVFRSEGTLEGLPVQMDWALTHLGGSYVRVMLTAEGEAQGERMIGMQQRVLDELAHAGVEAAMNAAVQGYSARQEGAAETIGRLEGDLGRTLTMRLVEDYEDGKTVSRSYEAPALGTFVKSGEQPIQMQLAVHEDSMKKSSRITIGFPVITVEY